MNHVGRRHQEAHLGTDRDDQRLVYLQQVVLILGCLVIDLALRRSQIAEEFDVLTQVLVMPLPLIAGDLDIQL